VRGWLPVGAVAHNLIPEMMMDNWTLERVEKALKYLAETDELEAELKSEVEGAKKMRDSMFTTIAAHASGTVLEREAAAYESDKYEQAENRYLDALSKHGTVKNKRHRADQTIDIWRSINSARGKGQVV